MIEIFPDRPKTDEVGEVLSRWIDKIPAWLNRVRFYLGTLSIDTSAVSGTTAVTGVGFQPKLVLFFGAEDAAPEMSIGADDGTTHSCVFDDHVDASDTWFTSAAASIRAQHSAGNFMTAAITSMDADGFTLTRTKTASPTGTFKVTYVALR